VALIPYKIQRLSVYALCCLTKCWYRLFVYIEILECSYKSFGDYSFYENERLQSDISI
jgi:hypothetical protein